jgi:hypothetical protein
MTMQKSKLTDDLRNIVDSSTLLPDVMQAKFHKSVRALWIPYSQVIEKHSQRNNISDKSRLGEEDVKRIIEQLQTCSNRDAGLSYLETWSLKRKDLESIARSLTLYFSKNDTVSRLRDNIVERTIGSRLNSKAIRGN